MEYSARPADPATRWRTTLPFPVHVVATVEVVTILRRPAYHRVPLPPRLLGRRRTRVPRVRDGRAPRHRNLRQPGRALLAADPDEDLVSPRPGRGRDRCRRLDRAGPQPRVLAGRPAEALPTGRADHLPCGPIPPGRRAALRTLRGHCSAASCTPSTAPTEQDRPYTVTESVAGVRTARRPASRSRSRSLPDDRMGTRRRADDRSSPSRPATTRTDSPPDRSRSPSPAAATRGSPIPPPGALPGHPRDHDLCPARRRRALPGRPGRRSTSSRSSTTAHPRCARCATPCSPRHRERERHVAAGDRALPHLLRRGRVRRSCSWVSSASTAWRRGRVAGLHRRLPRLPLRRRRPAPVSPRPAYLAPGPVSWPDRVPGRVPLTGARTRRIPALHRRPTFPGRPAATTSSAARHRYDVHVPGRCRAACRSSRSTRSARRPGSATTPHDLLPVRAVDAAGLETLAVNDYRVLAPRELSPTRTATPPRSPSPRRPGHRPIRRGKGGEGDGTPRAYG